RDAVDDPAAARTVQLGADDHLLDRTQPGAPVLARPGHADQPRLGEHRLPAAMGLRIDRVDPADRRRGGVPVLFDPRAYLRTIGSRPRRVVKVQGARLPALLCSVAGRTHKNPPETWTRAAVQARVASFVRAYQV